MKRRNLSLLAATLGFLFLTVWPASVNRPWAAEKLKLGASMKISPKQFLPVLAAEENGFWAKNGLEVDWVPFLAAGPVYQAVAAGHLNVGTATAISVVEAASRGIPVTMVMELDIDKWYVWVSADRPYKDMKDLKATRMGTPRFGGASHALARALAKATGYEKEFKYVAAGGMREVLAGMKTGIIDWTVQPLTIMVTLKMAGEVRELAEIGEFFPKLALGSVVFAKKDFAASRPETVKRVVKAMLEGVDYATRNRAWTEEKMQAYAQYSPEGARFMFTRLGLTKTGKTEAKLVETLRDFLIEYGMVRKETAPPVEELFSVDFLPWAKGQQ